MRTMFARLTHRLFLASLLVAVAWAVACAGVGAAATSGTVVGATVLSATNLGAGGCPTGTAGITHFGNLTAGSSTVTSSNCVITFGSSNDVARLRVAQTDQLGSAMYRTSTGASDATFSGDGVATFAPSAGNDVAASVAIQADGKMLISGTVDDAGTRRPYVARVTTAGILDPTFDTNGIREFPTLAANTFSEPQVTVDPQGRVLLAFYAAAPVGSIRVVRLLTDGSDDNTFGTLGIATHEVSAGGNSGWINDLTVDSAGRILLVGRAWPTVEFNWLSVAVRLTSTGGIDGTFGGDGIIPYSCPGTAAWDAMTDVYAYPDGSFVASARQLNGTYAMYALKSLPNGGLDPAFGTGGCTRLPSDDGSGLGVDSTGRLLFGHTAGITRLSAAGVIDVGGFGVGGTAAVGAAVREIAVDVDDTILVGSYNGGFRTTRLSTAGATVATHGTAGTATITVGNDMGALGRGDMALAPDGHIVQVGNDTSDGTAFDLVVVRREASKVANYGAGQDWLAGGTNGVFGACLRDATNGAITDGTTWTSNAGVACPASNGAIWKGIPDTTADPAALVARTTTSTTTTATATLQFGFRTASAQPPGTYLAPITFEVVAP